MACRIFIATMSANSLTYGKEKKSLVPKIRLISAILDVTLVSCQGKQGFFADVGQQGEGKENVQ